VIVDNDFHATDGIFKLFEGLEVPNLDKAEEVNGEVLEMTNGESHKETSGTPQNGTNGVAHKEPNGASKASTAA
jgi:hypothetical protein